jgi:hypothetical protein
VAPTTMTLTVGATGQITATVKPSNATNKKVNWTTSDANVATVDANGYVTAKKVGTATITATSAANSSKKASCEVTVVLESTPELFELRVNDMPVGAHDITITEAELNLIDTLAFHLTEEAVRAELLVTTTLENGIVVHEILADVDNAQYFSADMSEMKNKHGHFPAGVYYFTIKLTNNKGEVTEQVITVTALTQAEADALTEVNAYLTSEKYVYAEAPGKLEPYLTTLGLQVGEGSDYAALDKTADGGKNRKTAVFYDLNNNKPSAGYDLATLTTYFNDMVATRLVTEESMDLVNNAENIDALNGISFVTMLLERFQTVSYGTHSDIPVTEKIATLQGLVNRYNGLDADGQAAVLAKIIEKRPTDGYARSQATTDALKTALDEITFLTMSADDVTATIGVEFTMPVTTQGTVADADKENLVRFYGVITGLAASDITFESITGGSPAVVEGDERNNAGAGDGDLVLAWGPADGFPLGGTDEQPLDYANGVTTNFKATINKTGDYTVTFVFYDITGGKQLNAEGEKVTITVTDSEN